MAERRTVGIGSVSAGFSPQGSRVCARSWKKPSLPSRTGVYFYSSVLILWTIES